MASQQHLAAAEATEAVSSARSAGVAGSDSVRRLPPPVRLVGSVLRLLLRVRLLEVQRVQAQLVRELARRQRRRSPTRRDRDTGGAEEIDSVTIEVVVKLYKNRYTTLAHLREERRDK